MRIFIFACKTARRKAITRSERNGCASLNQCRPYWDFSLATTARSTYVLGYRDVVAARLSEIQAGRYSVHLAQNDDAG